MPDEVTQELKETGCRSVVEYLLYKLDRSLAIIGIIAIALVALFFIKTPREHCECCYRGSRRLRWRSS